MSEKQGNERWQWNLLLTVGVLTTILIGLLMAQTDNLQKRTRPSPPPFSANATIIAATQTQLAPIPLSSPTASATGIPVVFNLGLPANCGVIPDFWSAILVKAGDSLQSIANRFGISTAEIVRVNCTLPENVRPGIVLFVPPNPVVEVEEIPCGPPPDWIAYISQPGDTIIGLANAVGVQLGQFMVANCLPPGYELTAGKQIFVPFLPVTATPLPTMTASATAVIPTNTPRPAPSNTPTTMPTAVPTNSPTPTIRATVPATPSQTATTAASATATPIPTSLPTAPATETPSITPTTDVATNTPTPTNTAAPTFTPTQLPTSTATETPLPTSTPTPSNTPAPTDTPLPTDTPIPTDTATP